MRSVLLFFLSFSFASVLSQADFSIMSMTDPICPEAPIEVRFRMLNGSVVDNIFGNGVDILSAPVQDGFDGNGNPVFTISASFSGNVNDVDPTIQVDYLNTSGSIISGAEVAFPNVVKFRQQDVVSPSISTVVAPECEAASFNVSFPHLTLTNSNITLGETERYQYRIPVGWSINGFVNETSSGVWICSDNNATIISSVDDQGGEIQIRAINPCDNSCFTDIDESTSVIIPIIRPSQPSIIIGGDDFICGDDFTSYSILLPDNATNNVVWSITSNTGYMITNSFIYDAYPPYRIAILQLDRIGDGVGEFTVSIETNYTGGCTQISSKTVSYGFPEPTSINQFYSQCTRGAWISGYNALPSYQGIGGVKFNWYVDGVYIDYEDGPYMTWEDYSGSSCINITVEIETDCGVSSSVSSSYCSPGCNGPRSINEKLKLDRNSPVESTELPLVSSLKIYPNPADNFIMLDYFSGVYHTRSKPNIDQFSIEIINSLGHSVYNQSEVELGSKINLPQSLTNGIYYLRVLCKNGSTQTYKFLKK